MSGTVNFTRFYMVSGEKGWFPYGTDCSGGAKRSAYCVKGRCLEFGEDNTPLYEPLKPAFRSAHRVITSRGNKALWSS